MKAALKRERKYILWIFLFYLISQGLILIVSGMWSDDWCLTNISREGLKLWAWESGRPDFYYIFSAFQALPELVYKSVIFIGYFIVAICFFLIAKKSLLVESSDAFCLTLIYLCMPLNDARIARTLLPYTLGLALFFIAFFILVEKYDGFKLGYRITSLFLFFLSYIMNSLLVFMGLVWLYIIFKEKNFRRIIKKADFFLAPFFYYLINKTFFPTFGVYENYNKVTVEKLFGAFKRTFEAESKLTNEILTVFTKPLLLYPVILLAVLFVTMILYKISAARRVPKTQVENGPQNSKTIIVEALIGFVAFFAGLYPYVVVGNSITSTYYNGRNVILAPFGLALILHTIMKAGFHKTMRSAVVLTMMVISATHFCNIYVSYQTSYYRVRGMQAYLSQAPEIGELKTIAVKEEYYSGWYVYNGIFEQVYGNEYRLVDNVKSFNNSINNDWQVFIDREWYNMTGFDTDYHKIDGVILYSNSITPKEAMAARFHEILGEDISERLIASSSFQIIYPEDAEFSKYIYTS